MADAWEWVATLDDGSTVAERDWGTFTAVDLSRCVGVELIPRRGWGRKPVRVVVDPCRGERAVCFRRRQVAVSMDGRPPERPSAVSCIGCYSEAGSIYVWAYEDGRVLVTSSDVLAM